MLYSTNNRNLTGKGRCNMTTSTSNGDMATEVSGRIGKALEFIPSIPRKRGRISAAAQLFSESHQTVRLWLNSSDGTKAGMPDIRKIPNIAKILDVTIEWLLTGDGPMRPEDDTRVTIDKAVGGETVRFIHDELYRSGYFDLATHKQDSVFGLIYETLKTKPDGMSGEFKSFIVTTIDAFK